MVLILSCIPFTWPWYFYWVDIHQTWQTYLHNGDGIITHLVFDSNLIWCVQRRLRMSSKSQGIWLAHTTHLTTLVRITNLFLVNRHCLHFNLIQQAWKKYNTHDDRSHGHSHTHTHRHTNVLGHNPMLLDQWFPSVLKEHNATHPMRQHHTPDKHSPLLHYCENLCDSNNHKKFCTYFSISLKQLFNIVYVTCK